MGFPGLRAAALRVDVLHPEWFRADLGVLITLLAKGHLAPLVAERVPLEDARRAHDVLGRGRIARKVVIVPKSAKV